MQVISLCNIFAFFLSVPLIAYSALLLSEAAALMLLLQMTACVAQEVTIVVYSLGLTCALANHKNKMNSSNTRAQSLCIQKALNSQAHYTIFVPK